MAEQEDSVHFEATPLESGLGNAAIVTLNRPDSLNAIDSGMLNALSAALDRAESDSRTRIILLTGAGRAFSAGGDLKSYMTLQRDAPRFYEFVKQLHDVFGRLRKLDVPVVALVNGVTAAGGLELILGCDMAFAARSARIGDAHLNFGQMGGGGALTLLPRVVGIRRAAELVFSGMFLSAEEALEWGLVNRVVDDGALLEAGLAFGDEIAHKSPLAIANAKYVMASSWEDALSVDASLRLERERNVVYCTTSRDAPEGLAAFSERRKPVFEGK